MIEKFTDCDCAILVYADLQLLKPNQSKIKIYDTMKILSEATTERVLGK